ncbi:hypothetical protein [Paenirhodobacter populi]|uniref:hypothetical protein n=1 Tax=Paenirhodobacter populi TaxID=2306993 RepID=UPI0013E29F7C|nr:hypothetical protein [Sinirhodobacter populi]
MKRLSKIIDAVLFWVFMLSAPATFVMALETYRQARQTNQFIQQLVDAVAAKSEAAE